MGATRTYEANPVDEWRQLALIEKMSAIWHHTTMADDEYPSDAADRFQVRMPHGMRERLKAEAEANKRSMNAEIVARLEDSFTRAEQDAAALKSIEISRLVDTYNYEAKNFERMQQDIVRMGEHLRIMEQSLREAGVTFREEPPPPRQGGEEVSAEDAIREFVEHRARERSQAARPRKWSTKEIIEFARQLVAADNGEQLQGPDTSKKAS